MPISTAVIALIRKEGGGQTQWLARWSPDYRGFNFLGRRKTDGKTCRDCVIREMIDKLGLQPEADFVVADAPHSRLEYVGWSNGTRGETACKMELYPVELTGDFSQERIESDAANRWLLEAEIQAGATKDGHPVSGTMNLFLELAGLFNHRPSDRDDSED